MKIKGFECCCSHARSDSRDRPGSPPPDGEESANRVPGDAEMLTRAAGSLALQPVRAMRAAGRGLKALRSRRKIIEEKFADLIDALYGGKDSIYTETEVTYEDGRKGAIKATLTIRDAKVEHVAERMAAE